MYGDVSLTNLQDQAHSESRGLCQFIDGLSQQPAIINGGASDDIGKVFSDKGIHTHSAVGTNALPLDVVVEIEAVVEVEDYSTYIKV